MGKIKVLINTPDISKIGGVANFYQSLHGKFENEVRYNFIGGSSKKSNFIFSLIADYFRYIIVLIRFRPDLVHLNPSLDKKSVLRDAVYVIITKVFFRKLLVFWHGWQDITESAITKKYSFFFRLVYNLADSHCVLASDFKKILINWGISKPVYLETTIFNEDILNGFRIEDKKIDPVTILFLSRIEEQKGIFIVLETFGRINKEFPECKLAVAGTGQGLNKAKKIAEDKQIRNVEFLGFITGEKKRDIIQKSLINFFPTFYGEGMPISILESMACGSIIITRPVGGIKDFFENGIMGSLTESKDPADYEIILSQLLRDKNKLKEISEYNHKYALEHFRAIEVAKRIEKIYSGILKA